MENTEILSRAKAYIQEETDPGFRGEVERLIADKNWKELEDRFYQNLEFGTGGLRGIIGGGTNRMNTLVVNRATQGLADYVAKAFPEKDRAGKLSAVIAYDSRHFSALFAESAALIFAARGFKTYLFTSLRPTPELSFAIRELGCDTGVVVTASHNPPQYNGYKAYWNTGGQVIEPHDEGIIAQVNGVTSVKTITRLEAIARGLLVMIDKDIDIKYESMVRASLFRPGLIKERAGEVKIVYTPLHGTGAMHVESVLGSLGLRVISVPEQREPDGDFPTVEKPNPEEAPAMKLAIELGRKEKADVVMATDPDADRFGTAFPDREGAFVLVTGNQMGALLTDYICLSRKELGIMPPNPVVVRSIVSTALADKIAASYGVDTVECLTGFKWIGDAMEEFNRTGSRRYIFGFEESYGYTVEDSIRDKDGVSAAALCAEMTLYWRSVGKSLLERIEELYKRFGYYEDRAISRSFPGEAGAETMRGIMSRLRREGLTSLGGKRVLRIRDVEEGAAYDPASPGRREPIGLPKSNVLQFFLEGDTVVSARPSGTEPKIKFYISCHVPVADGDLGAAKHSADTLCNAVTKEIEGILASA
ncbi:MAG: phospho-sugar mutase [Spirochaetaceae bacterium]|jgi:phosphoglucomutase|nr:phospho-sugar mutase [Spirochaetaceae bacterium]